MKKITLKNISNIENLYWAWHKVKRFYIPGEIWYDELELAGFELNLHDNLLNISENILNGEYTLNLIKPIAYPKGPDNNNKNRIRQYFWVSVRDQVAWMAIVNIIGPLLDYQMPFWSYGNRLYRPVWFTNGENENKKTLNFGWYRNTSQHTYRKWNQSWPMYRRHISIAIKLMSKKSKSVDEYDKELIEQNRSYPDNLKVKYLEKEFWKNRGSDRIYWTSIDLRKFYPNISNDKIIENIKKHLTIEQTLLSLIDNMLTFKVDVNNWEGDDIKDQDLFNISDPNNFTGIPTGLFVAGFLCNIAMLEVDYKISKKIYELRNIAHFRYVDDHVFITNNFNNLVKWILDYSKLLKSEKIGPEFNLDKIEPEKSAEFIKQLFNENNINFNKLNEIKGYQKAKTDTQLDPFFQTPLMTATLRKMSNIAQANLNLLDDNEFKTLLNDVEHLILSDFPDQEVKKETRISFAARMLSILGPERKIDNANYYKYQEKLRRLEIDNEKLTIELRGRKRRSKLFKEKWLKREENNAQILSLNNLLKQLSDEVEQFEKNSISYDTRIFQKVIIENHDKLKLWLRYLEYCQRTGSNKYIEIFDKLNNIKTCHKYSTIFLRSILLQILAHQLLLSYKISISEQTSSVKKRKAIKFVNSVFKYYVLDRLISKSHKNNFYFESSLEFFNTIISSIYFLILESDGSPYLSEKKNKYSKANYSELTKRYKIIDWNGDFINYFRTKKTSVNNWIWILINYLPENDTNVPNLFWEKWIKKCDLDNKNTWSLLSLYPNKLNSRILSNILQNSKASYLRKNLGWVNELRQENKLLKKDKVNIELRFINNSNKKSLTLNEWNSWIKNYIGDNTDYNVNKVFDPRISEWTCLEIVKQIAQQIIKGKVLEPSSPKSILEKYITADSPYFNIHPDNYLINKESIEKVWQFNKDIPTWKEWIDWIDRKTSKIHLVDKKYIIIDSRYNPSFYDIRGFENQEKSAIYGLGLILVGLLSHDFKFNPFFNLKGYHKQKSYFALKKLEKIPISSWTIYLLRGIFSKRRKEEVFLQNLQSPTLSLSDDTKYDPPNIRKLDDLIKCLEISEEILVSYHLTVQDHKPRHLIPVNLIQIAYNESPYKVTND